MSTTELVPWGEQFVPSRAERRKRRRHQRFVARAILAAPVVFLSAVGVVMWRAPIWSSDEPAGAASPATVVSTTSTVPPPVTTALVPETVPVPTVPGWITVRVTLPGFDGLGKLVTDGVHTTDRILPGEPGRSVIAVPVDPSPAATVIVEGVEWRVFGRGQVASNNLAAVTGPWPVVPVVLVVSSIPADARPYVEARR